MGKKTQLFQSGNRMFFVARRVSILSRQLRQFVANRLTLRRADLSFGWGRVGQIAWRVRQTYEMSCTGSIVSVEADLA